MLQRFQRNLPSRVLKCKAGEAFSIGDRESDLSKILMYETSKADFVVMRSLCCFNGTIPLPGTRPRDFSQQSFTLTETRSIRG